MKIKVTNSLLSNDDRKLNLFLKFLYLFVPTGFKS